MELFDILSFSRAKAEDLVVPAAYNVEDVETTLVGAPAGTYMFFYSFEVTFGTKLKPINWQVTGTFGNTVDDYSFESTADEIGNAKNKMYGFPVVHAGGDLTLGLRFKDQESAGDIIVDFVDVVITRVK